jgi:hypothetical protein
MLPYNGDFEAVVNQEMDMDYLMSIAGQGYQDITS